MRVSKGGIASVKGNKSKFIIIIARFWLLIEKEDMAFYRASDDLKRKRIVDRIP